MSSTEDCINECKVLDIRREQMETRLQPGEMEDLYSQSGTLPL